MRDAGKQKRPFIRKWKHQQSVRDTMKQHCQITYGVILLSFITLMETASVNVSISSPDIQNGSSINLAATFDPTVGDVNLKDVVCEYTKPGGGAPNTRLTTYHTGLRQIVPSSTLSASESSRLTILSSGKPLMLTIAPITFEDEKRQFFCTLEYYIGLSAVIIRSKQHTLENVYSPAVLNVADSMQTSTSITGGIAANFTCIATGRPAPTITWQYSLGVSATISNTFVGSPLITVTGILSIHNPTQTMDGLKVTCFVSHQFTPMINRTTTLSVFYRPINTILIIYPQGPKLNEDITLNCNAIGKPNVITYRFFINQTYIGNSTSGNLTVKSNNCLRYNGYYKCIPVNVRGEGEEKQQLVVVKDNVRTSTASSSLTFNETQSTTLFCTVSGCPEPSVSWSRNGVSLNRYGNSLTLPLLNSGHAGRYSCNASNAFTNSSSQIEVTVNYKPVGTQLSSNNAKPLVNSSVGFSCTSDAVPVANYRFVRVDGSGEREVSSSNSEITGILMVSRIIHAPNAYNVTYKCIPHNMLGNGLEQRVMVDIQVPARIEQFTLTPRTVNETGNVSIECISSGNPLPNITITGPNNVTVQHSIGKATLNNVNRNQAGLYTCKTSNGVSSPVNATIELVVNYIPVISSLRAAPPQTYTGSYSIITCVAIGTPRPSYRYYNEIGTLLIDTVAVVHPVTLRYEDYPRYRATFRCVPYNIMGEGTAQNVTVEILVPPRLSVSMSPETVNETDNAAFSCAVLAANPSSNITLRGLLNQTLLHTSGTTILSNLNRDDAGTYSCVASNGLRGGPVIETAKLSVNHAPDQVQFTASTPKPISGSSVTLNCMARGSPSPSFRFILVNGSSTKIIQNGPSSSCVIFKLDYKDYSNYTATYRCISYNTFGDSSPQDETLNIQVRPVLSFSITPSIVTETQNVTANCKVLAANPAPNITIRGNNKEIIPHIGGQAELELITIAQAGEYSCIADNGVVGTTTSTATLNVNYAPDRVDLSSSSMTPLNGSSVTLNCSSSGLPPPHRFVFSRINGPTQTAVQDSASSIYLNRMINFKNFISYKAIFACVPYNTVGRGLSKNITLDIQVRPEVSVTSPITALEGDNVNFRCTVTAANPTASVMWRGPSNTVLSSSPLLTLNSVNRNQVGEYTCIASNGISPNARKTTFLSVNYSPRFKENSKVYEKCIGENASILCSAVGSPIPDISLYLNGILLASNVRGLRYHVAIDSTSRFGAYMCSSKNSVGTVNITTIIKVKPPGNVTNINLRVNKNTIRVTWDLPQCKGNIKEVKVQYRKKGECNWGMRSSTVTTTDKEFIINGLDNGVEYEVRIVVVDISGKEHMMQASGTAKIDVDECATGAHKCHVQARCLNTPGSYECKCLDNLSGNGYICNERAAFKDDPTTQRVKTNSIVTLSCSYYNSSSVEFHWIKDGQVLNTSKYITEVKSTRGSQNVYTTKHDLKFNISSIAQQGRYWCRLREGSTVQKDSRIAAVILKDASATELPMEIKKTYNKLWNDTGSPEHQELKGWITDAIKKSVGTGSLASRKRRNVQNSDPFVQLTNIRSSSSGTTLLNAMVYYKTATRDSRLAVCNAMQNISSSPLSTSSIQITVTARKTYDCCYSDFTGNPDIKGVIYWPTQVINERSIVGCPATITKANATRYCVSKDFEEEPVWQSPNTSTCLYVRETTQKLSDLTKATVNATTVVKIVKELEEVTKNETNIKTYLDVAFAVDVIVNVADSQSNNTEAFDGIMNVTSSLMSADANVVKDAQKDNNASARLMKAVEKFADNIPLGKNETTKIFSKKNLAIGITEITAKAQQDLETSGFVIKGNIGGGKTSVEMIKEKNEPVEAPAKVADLKLPGPLFKVAKRIRAKSNATDALRVTTLLYDNAKLFSSESTSGANASKKINSKVLAVGIKGIKLENLTEEERVRSEFRVQLESQGLDLCVYWEEIEREWSQRGCRYDGKSATDNKIGKCSCNHMTNFALLLDVTQKPTAPPEGIKEMLKYFTYIGCGLSLAGLTITLLTLCFFKKVRQKPPQKIIMGVCISLILALIAFLVASQHTLRFNEENGVLTPASPVVCLVSSVAIHYFVVCSFLWMAMQSYYLYLSCVKVMNVRSPNILKWMALISFGIPLVIVAIVLGVQNKEVKKFADQEKVNKNQASSILLESNGYVNIVDKNNRICMINGISFYVAYLVPIGLILIINFVFLVLSIRGIFGSAQKTGRKGLSMKRKFRIILSCVTMMGLTWLIGMFAIGPLKIALQVLFTIFNSLQGVLIFLFYCLLNKKVQEEWRACLFGGERSDSSVPSSKKTSVKSSEKRHKRRSLLGKKEHTSSSMQSVSKQDEYKESILALQKDFVGKEYRLEGVFANLEDRRAVLSYMGPLDDSAHGGSNTAPDRDPHLSTTV